MSEPTLRPDTLAVRAGLARSGFEETAEAMYLTSGFVYDSAEAAEAAFAGESERFVYSRYGNPTTAMLEQRLAALEGAEACSATASGMSAVFTALAALLGAGDRVVASRGLFGSCFVILDEILPRWGVETVFVDGPDLEQWRKALAEPTTAVFFESPSNPMQELVDMRAVCDLAHLGPPRRLLTHRLMGLEAAAMTAALESLRAAGVLGLPVHDSLIVPAGAEGLARRALVAGFEAVAGATPAVKPAGASGSP